jgi:hypothetical protein
MYLLHSCRRTLIDRLILIDSCDIAVNLLLLFVCVVACSCLIVKSALRRHVATSYKKDKFVNSYLSSIYLQSHAVNVLRELLVSSLREF